MRNIYSENNELYKRVTERLAGTAMREHWLEEGFDTGHSTVQTELIDRLVNIKTGEEELFVGHNLIVVGFGLLVGALLKGDSTYGHPIQYWSVGEGEGDFWDDLSVEARQAKSIYGLTQLYDETFRVTVNTIFIDANSDPVVPGPSNRIEVQATFGPDVVGELREFGLWGGNASATLGTGILLDHKSHAVLNVNNTPGQANVLIRALRITV